MPAKGLKLSGGSSKLGQQFGPKAAFRKERLPVTSDKRQPTRPSDRNKRPPDQHVASFLAIWGRWRHSPRQTTNEFCKVPWTVLDNFY